MLDLSSFDKCYHIKHWINYCWSYESYEAVVVLMMVGILQWFELGCSTLGNRLTAPLGLAESDNQGHTMLSACCDLWQNLFQTTAFSAVLGPLVRTMFLLYWFALILVLVNMLLYCNSALVTKGFDRCSVPIPQRSLIIKSQVSKVNEPVCIVLDLWCHCTQCLIQKLWYVYAACGHAMLSIDYKSWLICKSEALIIKTLSEDWMLILLRAYYLQILYNCQN